MSKGPVQEPIEIHRRPGGSYRLSTEILLDRDLDEVFAFFSDPHNLAAITPPWLGLRVRGEQAVAMAKGTRIKYWFRVRGIPAFWHSEITAWDPPHRFVDQQRRGPFVVWIHEHRFARIGDRTLAADRVNYVVPGGRLVHALLVGKDLRRLFAYRHRRMRELFGARD